MISFTHTTFSFQGASYDHGEEEAGLVNEVVSLKSPRVFVPFCVCVLIFYYED